MIELLPSPWNEYPFGVVLVIQWVLILTMLLYSKFRLRRDDWTLALFVGFIYATIGLLHLFTPGMTMGSANLNL